MQTQDRQAIILIAPPAALGIIALAASVALGTGAAAFVLGSLAIACVAVAAWRATVIDRSANAIVEQTPAQVASVRTDRRRPTFDRETGLLAEWYFRLRFEEEITRAKRYGHALTALTISSSAPEGYDTARLAVRAYLRQVDFAGDLSGTICVCLPDTTREASQAVVDRMNELVDGLVVAAREYPADGTTLSALLNEHAWHTTPDEAAAQQGAA